MNPSRMKMVYVVKTYNKRTFWNRVGVAFVNRDGSLNVKLDAVPVDGDLHIRDQKDEDIGTARASRLPEDQLYNPLAETLTAAGNNGAAGSPS